MLVTIKIEYANYHGIAIHFVAPTKKKTLCHLHKLLLLLSYYVARDAKGNWKKKNSYILIWTIYIYIKSTQHLSFGCLHRHI